MIIFNVYIFQVYLYRSNIVGVRVKKMRDMGWDLPLTLQQACCLVLIKLLAREVTEHKKY